MADKTIITQAEAVDAKFTFSAIVENFVKHINQDLSSAHGINLAWGKDAGSSGDGNDYSKYYDTFADVVGDYQVRFTVAGTPYFAPAKLSTREGQPAGTNSTDIVNYANSEVALTALATEIITTETDQISAILTSYLIPHTVKHLEDTHQSYATSVQDTLDSNGDVVGDFLLALEIDGAIYHVPCTNNIGGIPILPALSGLDTHDPDGPRSYSWVDSGGGPNYASQCVVAKGKLPIIGTFQYDADFLAATETPTHWHTFPWPGNLVGVYPSIDAAVPIGYTDLAGDPATFTVTSLPTTIKVDWNPETVHIGHSGHLWTRLVLNTQGSSRTHECLPVSNTVQSAEDDKFVCGYALASGAITETEYTQAVRFVKRQYGKTYLQGYRVWASPLTAWAKQRELTAKLLAWFGRYHVQGLAKNKRNPLWIAFELAQFSVSYLLGLAKRLQSKFARRVK